jgi:hypothetical protein
MISCTGIKHYANTEGMPRPKNNNVFTYKKYADLVYPDSIVDTIAIYCSSHIDSLTNTQHYQYYRFLNHGRLFFKSGKGELSNINNDEDAFIGYYYIKNQQLRTELFEETYGIRGSLVKTFGYFSNDTLFTFIQTPETFFNSYRFVAKSETVAWKKIKPDTLVSVSPNW